MPGITMNATVFTLDKKNVEKISTAFAEDAMRKAIKVFLRICIQRIPVRTGFVRGAFTEIIKKFLPEQTAFSKNISTQIGRRQRAGEVFPDKEYYYYGIRSRLVKTQSSGIRFVTPADKVLTVLKNGVSKFLLNVRISYYRINDFYARVRGAPWESMKAGQLAMQQYLEQAYKRFPKIEKILTETKIILDGTRFSTTKTEPNIQLVINEMKSIP